MWGIIQVIFYDFLDLTIFTNLFTDAILPWWTSIVLNFKKFILEYLTLTMLTLILVNHDIVKPISFNDLIEILKPKT